MNVAKLVKAGATLGVFTRNYKGHLQEALELSRQDPNRLITFRSKSDWASAAAALQHERPVFVYFAVVDAGPNVQYVARLERVIQNPERGQPETEHLLSLCTSTTSKEGLWEHTGKPAQALYAVSHLREVTPFPMTALHKASNDTPIDPNYGYSYVFVHARPEDTNDG